eukprot:g4275.t1
MSEIAEDATSAAAAAANTAISETVSAMLDSATTSAAKSSAAPGMAEEVSELQVGSIAVAGIAETVSAMLENATMAAVAATHQQGHQAAVVTELGSALAAATNNFVSPLSPLGPTVDHTTSGIELSGRRVRDDEEGSEYDGLRLNNGSAAHVADGSRESRRGQQLETVVISAAGPAVDDEAEVKDGDEGCFAQYKVDDDEHIGVRHIQSDAQESGERKNVQENEAEKLGLAEDCDDQVSRSSRAVDGDDHGIDRSQESADAAENIREYRGEAKRQHGDGRAGDNSGAAGENSQAPKDRPSASQLPEGKGDMQQQWQWWDSENPWSRGPRSSTSRDRKSIDRKLFETGPPPPVYQETRPPPPYQEVVAGLPASRALMQKQATQQHDRPWSASRKASDQQALLSATAVSNDGSSGDDTSRGPPPSYRAAVVGRTVSRSSSSDEGEEKQTSVRHLPPPSYGRFYDDVRSATSIPPLQGETDSRDAKSNGGEWWAQEDQDNQYAPVWSGKCGGQERESWGRRTRASSGDTGGSSGISGDGLQKPDRPETVGDEHEDEGSGGVSWRRRPYSEGRVRRATAARGGTESWDDDRWRLTRYLHSCKRELAEAEEKRRRAEAAANAAERSAWAAGNSKGEDDDGAKRAWARAATQRVLDLMLVTERVRQEEQKRRVAAARASNQVARCKQPFRERRGRSQKGAFIGPSVPPTDVLEPPSQQRTEAAAMRDIYWDEHGRRYSRRGGAGNGSDDQNRTSGEVGVALEIVRNVAGACLEEGTDFGQPFREIDANGDGRLTLAELGAALRRSGARLSLSQITALFRHFDEGLGLDTVGRRQFVWEFVDSKRLLKQWRKAGDVLGGHSARMAPFRNRAKKASNDGMLSRNDVLRSLGDLGVHVDGWEADALLDRFTAQDGSDNVDWRAFVSFMQAAENQDDATHNNNGGNSSTDGMKNAGRSRRERGGLRTSPPRHSRHHQRHWATSGLRRGGGLFEGEGNLATWGRPSRRTETTTPTPGGKPYYHWASSAPPSAWGRRKADANGSGNDPTARPKTATTFSTGRGSSAEATREGSSLRPSSPSSAPRGGRGARGGGLVTSVAEASRVLDGLLEDQQELEAFLEEEIAKREREGGRGEGSFARRGLV